MLVGGTFTLIAGARAEATAQALNSPNLGGRSFEAASDCADCRKAAVSPKAGESVQAQARALVQRVYLFVRDNREYVSQTGENQRYAPIFRTQTTRDVYEASGQHGRGEATGFMISPCFAAVNAHAVFGEEAPPELKSKVDWASGKDFGIRFFFRRNASGALRPIAEQPVAHPIGEELPSAWIGDRSRDFAVVRFKRGECPGEDLKVGWVDLVVADWKRLVGVKMSMAGFPGDRDRVRLSIERGCTFRGWDGLAQAVDHDCGSEPGSSGSPIFGEIDGRLKVVALDVGTNGYFLEVGKAKIVQEESAAANHATMVGSLSDDAYTEAHQDFLDHGIKDIPDWAK